MRLHLVVEASLGEQTGKVGILVEVEAEPFRYQQMLKWRTWWLRSPWVVVGTVDLQEAVKRKPVLRLVLVLVLVRLLGLAEH
jgi:hypothetical protein